MRRLLALALLVSAGACTFGGLGDYEIGECNPAAPKASDPCDALNAGNETTCTPYRCSPDTRRCAKLPRDDDRDGVLSGACGGADCDDDASQKFPGNAEICDLIDNDCNGLADDGVEAKAPSLATDKVGEQADDSQIVGESSSDLLGTWIGKKTQGGKCLFVSPLPAGTGGDSCALLTNETNLEPRQPHARPLVGGTAAVMLKTLECATGELIYRFAGSGQAGGGTFGCQPSGAALPAMALASDDNQAIIAYYSTSYLARKDDPVQGCPTAGPAPLVLALVSGAKSASPILGTPVSLAPDAISVRRPALVSIAGKTLVASPAGDDVGLWSVDVSTGSVEAPAKTSIPELAGARAVSVAARENGGAIDIAVAAELGCSPERIALALLTLDAGGFSEAIVVEVAAASSGPATGTSVAWQADLGEWMVAWTVAGPKARVRRVRASDLVLGDTFDVPGFIEARAATNGDLLLQKAIPQGSGGTKREFWFVRGACSQ